MASSPARREPIELWWYVIAGIFFVILLSVAARAQKQEMDGGWPRTLQSDGLQIQVYQPHVDRWEGGKLQDRTAVVVTDRSTGEAIYGTAWLSGKTWVDADQRLVTLYDIQVSKASFPAAGAREVAYVAKVTDALQSWQMMIALDRLLADIAITHSEEKSAGEPLSNAPPAIFVRKNPAVLILVDGKPILQKIPDTSFMRVINTPALMVTDSASSRYFLRGEGYWMTAASVEGSWSKAANPPGALASLLEPGEESAPGAVIPPEVIVSTEPAELIQIDGDAQFSPIDGTRLLYLTNTDSDVFMSLPQQRYYVLLSGRWFSSPGLEGPWAFVPGSALPLDFARIPGGHPKSAVLASVPGTPEAREAVVAAQVPQTATVDRRKAEFTATYDGEPQFKTIDGTEMAYATNSPDDIIRARGKYYAVKDGVWFVAESPRGPWSVCDYVPPEIYSIPPTVPVYHVKYVHVYDSTPDWVYTGYTPGYFGAFIWDDVVVYGTGYHYPCWYGDFYYGCPWTWGFGFHYGYWGGGFFWRPWFYSPWYWHPWHGHHAPYAWWNRVLYNRSAERHGRAGLAGRSNLYDRWRGQSVVNRHPVPLRSAGRIAPRSMDSSRRSGSSVSPRRTGSSARDLYAGRDGQVYSHQRDGWYRRSGNAWERTSVPRVPQPQARPQATPPAREHRFGELESNRQARIQGQNRVQQYRNMSPPARTTSPPPRMSSPSPRMSAPSRGAGQPRMSAPSHGAGAPRGAGPSRGAGAPRGSAPSGAGRQPGGGGRRR